MAVSVEKAFKGDSMRLGYRRGRGRGMGRIIRRSMDMNMPYRIPFKPVPTSIIPKIDKEKCTGCGKCKEACSFGAISMVDKKAVIDPALCRNCGVCIPACTFNAIS